MELSKEMDEFVSELTDEFARELAYQDATREKIRVLNEEQQAADSKEQQIANVIKKITGTSIEELDEKIQAIEKKKEAHETVIKNLNEKIKTLKHRKRVKTEKERTHKLIEIGTWSLKIACDKLNKKENEVTFEEFKKVFNELVNFEDSTSNKNNKLENNETETIPEKEVSNSNSNSADNSTTAADLDNTPYELDADAIEFFNQQLEETIRAKKVMEDSQSPLSTDSGMGEEK